MEADEHLFRRESARLVAVLTRIFGVHNLALAEDVVQDAFCQALDTWKFRGMPENPSAWLMATARRRALDVLRRERTARTFAPDLGRLLESEWTLRPLVEELFRPQIIRDDELRMMFTCCHPRLPEVAQVALVLHILCGFSVGEVAGAFLTGHDAMEKRLTRAKKTLAEPGKLRGAGTDLFELRDEADVRVRLDSVRRALYLLFNEGYHGASPESAVRAELCREALRLVTLLLEHPLTATSATYALGALICLHAARLPGRVDDAGDFALLADQDRTRWDRDLIARGLQWLQRSAEGAELTEYHLEAGIAELHAEAASSGETDWRTIVTLYDTLLRLRPSPVVALSRAIAVGQAEGAAAGLAAIDAIGDRERLESYPFYAAARADFQQRLGHHAEACALFRRALEQARNPMERRFLERRLRACAEVA